MNNLVIAVSKNYFMNITRTSMISGITRTIDLPITEAQLADYESGTHLQRAFPNLPAPQREFIKTGITSNEWDEMCLDEDEEDFNDSIDNDVDNIEGFLYDQESGDR